ncbi:hypothetical protein BH24DEI2_BH24DEI2_16930 [soil metagenome]
MEMETRTEAHVDWPALLNALAEPFPQEAVSWRAGALSRDKKRAQALPYAEPRVYEDRLNTVCPGDWSVRFVPWGDNRIICELTIHGVTRSSTGEESEGGFAPGIAAEAQAFKRACSKFGLGRYVYDIGIDWIDYDEDKKRLVKTPNLPDRFLPTKKAAVETRAEIRASAKPAPTPLPKAQAAKVLETPQAPLLTPDRAEAMAKELEKLGFARNEQLKLSTSVLGHPVRAFTQLTEAEALEVWASAKRLSKSVA